MLNLKPTNGLRVLKFWGSILAPKCTLRVNFQLDTAKIVDFRAKKSQRDLK